MTGCGCIADIVKIPNTGRIISFTTHTRRQVVSTLRKRPPNAGMCSFRRHTRPAGVRQKTWTELRRQPQVFSIFDGTAEAERFLDSALVVPADVIIEHMDELLDCR